MLHALLVTFALLSSPLECCGCGGFWFGANRTCAPAPKMSIALPSPNIARILRVDEYSPALRWGLVIIAPRPLSSVVAATLQADAQSRP